MHELGITQNIVDIAQQHALEQGAQKVLSVTVMVGDLSGVIADAMEFCFEVCCKDTLLEQAELIIQRIPGRGRCRDCGTDIELDTTTFSCPACGSFALETVSGQELSIKEMEVE